MLADKLGSNIVFCVGIKKGRRNVLYRALVEILSRRVSIEEVCHKGSFEATTNTEQDDKESLRKVRNKDGKRPTEGAIRSETAPSPICSVTP